jgi:hypothetical protein
MPQRKVAAAAYCASAEKTRRGVSWRAVEFDPVAVTAAITPKGERGPNSAGQVIFSINLWRSGLSGPVFSGGGIPGELELAPLWKSGKFLAAMGWDRMLESIDCA